MTRMTDTDGNIFMLFVTDSGDGCMRVHMHNIGMFTFILLTNSPFNAIFAFALCLVLIFG